MLNPVQNPEASEFSFKETASSFPILELKNNNLYLNLITVFQPGARYFDDSFKSIFVCLKHSKISTALTLSKTVPISVLSRAYGTARYDKSSESMFFDLATNKSTSITKQHFCKLLNLPVSTELIHPDSVSNVDLINMCNKMETNQPTTGSDNASKLLLTLIYAIYTNQNIDIGQILWTQFCLSPNSNTRTTHISMAHFWGIVVDGALNKFKELRGDSNTAMAEVSELQVNKLQFVKDRVFEHCGEIPLEMWSSVPENEPQKKKVKKDNQGALPAVVLRAIPDDVQERIEALATKKPQVKRKRGDQIETEQVQPEPQKKPKKVKIVARKSSKKPKQTPTLQDEPSDDDEVTQSNTSHHSEPEQTERQQNLAEGTSSKTPPHNEAGTSTTPPRQDTTFDNLENIEKLTQTPPVPPHETEQEDQTHQSSPHQSDSEPADEEMVMEGPSGDLFNPNQATSSTYVKPTDTFTFLPVTFEEEEFSAEQQTASQYDLIKNQTEEFNVIRKELLTSIDTLQADFTSKLSDVEKKIDESSKSATNESELKAKVHALELQIKELGTQLESKTHEAEHRLRVIEMYKAQNHETNLKLVKLVEDKDAQVLKLSEKVDAKFEQMLKTLSELSVPKVIERVIEKQVFTSQEGGDKEESEQNKQTESKTQKKSPPKQTEQPPKKPKRTIQKGILIKPIEESSSKKPETKESDGRGKGKVTEEEAEQTKRPDTSKDEEIARKLEEEERIKASEEREKDKIADSELRIWPIWSKSRIAKLALPPADPYWLHPVASERINVDANYQLDMPLCPRAFIFKFMEPVPGLNVSEQKMNQTLINFYAREAKPQQKVWSSVPIKKILKYRRTELVANSFYNWEFEILRGTEKKKEVISFANFPLMNPSDWIMMHQIFVLKGEDSVKPQIEVFKLLMQNYMFEMGKFDLIASEIMKRDPKIVDPVYVDYGINSDGLITKDPWGIVVKITVNGVEKFGHLMMTDLYTLIPAHLQVLKQKIFISKRNSEEDRKAVYNRICWYEAVRSKILMFNNFMKEHEEK
ncbi:hypothetical protein LXL04_034305 [Taraxacum kok-saghyz]